MNDISKDAKDAAEKLLSDRRDGEAKLSFQTDALGASRSGSGFVLRLVAPNVFISIDSLESETHDLKTSKKVILISDYDYGGSGSNVETQYKLGTLKTHVTYEGNQYHVTININARHEHPYKSELNGTVKATFPKE